MKPEVEGMLSIVAERAFSATGGSGAKRADGASGRQAGDEAREGMREELAELRRYKAEHQALVRQREADLRELENTRRLQQISAQLIEHDNIEALYERIMDTAVSIMRSDFASMQRLYPERGAKGELRLLGHRGFSEASAATWQWVSADSACICGEALRKGGRVIVPDFETCAFVAGTPGQAAYRAAGIRSAKSTLLRSRSGKAIGMISTHWGRVHEPSESELRLFDVLARQAADLIERRQNEETLREHAARTEKAVAERTAELSASNQQLESFVYSIAHDLRGPLRSMQGFSEVLLEEAEGKLSAEALDCARRINRSAVFMDALLRDLLVFSRLSQQQIALEPVDLAPVVEAAVARFETEIRERGATVDSAGPWPKAIAHEPMVGQILYNLLSNALKFVAPGRPPLLRLVAEEREGFIRVAVIDNGVGIAREYQEQIFRLFTRLHGDRFQGTGIGLTIVQKGAERMGGRAGVESEPGQGSRFWFEMRKA